MGSLFSSPKPPTVAMPPPAAHPPVLGNSASLMAEQATKSRAAAAAGAGLDGTVGTSPEGAPAQPSTAKATLLGA